MLSDFYKPRWQQFFSYVNQQIQLNQPVDETIFGNQLKNWEWNWVNGHNIFTTQPQGDPVQSAKKMYTKYRTVMEASL